MSSDLQQRNRQKTYQMLDEAKDNNNQKKVDLIKKVIALKESQKQKEVNPFNVGVRPFSDSDYEKHFGHQHRR